MNREDTKIYKLGRNIAKFRKRKGLSQNAFVEIIDISREHLSHVETASRTPSLELVFKISEALDVPVKELFDFE